MEKLIERIKSDGVVVGNDILKVDSFINHQIDTLLLDQICQFFASKFENVDKILTIEASGIAFAVGLARYFNFCPVVFAKKSKSKILDDKNIYKTNVASFTHGNVNQVSVDKRFLKKEENILIVDDFLAEGNAALGLIDLCQQAGSRVLGVCIVVEKGFQNGRKRIEQEGVKVVSAAVIDHFENGKVLIK